MTFSLTHGRPKTALAKPCPRFTVASQCSPDTVFAHRADSLPWDYTGPLKCVCKSQRAVPSVDHITRFCHSPCPRDLYANKQADPDVSETPDLAPLQAAPGLFRLLSPLAVKKWKNMIARCAASPAGGGGIRLCFDRNPLSNRTGFVVLFFYPGCVLPCYLHMAGNRQLTQPRRWCKGEGKQQKWGGNGLSCQHH